jgi:hypothetical protein
MTEDSGQGSRSEEIERLQRELERLQAEEQAEQERATVEAAEREAQGRAAAEAAERERLAAEAAAVAERAQAQAEAAAREAEEPAREAQATSAAAAAAQVAPVATKQEATQVAPVATDDSPTVEVSTPPQEERFLPPPREDSRTSAPPESQVPEEATSVSTTPAPTGASTGLLATTQRKLLAGGAAVVLGAVVLFVALSGGGGGGGRGGNDFPGGGGSSGDGGTGTSTGVGLTLEQLKAATVLITEDPEDPEQAGWGSGSIISDDGLILTNAHVAANRAPGLSVLFKQTAGEFGPASPDTLYIYTVDGDDPAVPMYQAELVVADGFLDLAILRITATADGTPVDASTLDLTPVPIGSIHDLSAGDDLTILGFPGVADSFRVHITKGPFSNLSDDNLRVGSAAWINTEAKVAPGNSGGLAASADGFIVGVPDQIKFEGERGEISEYVLRPVDFALPLIEAANTGGSYDPYQYVPDSTGQEQATVKGWAAPEIDGCADGGASTPTPGATVLAPIVELSGVPHKAGLIIYLIHGSGDSTKVLGGYPIDWEGDESAACLTLPFKNQGEPFPDGDYTVAALTGPTLEVEIPFSNGQIALGDGGTSGGNEPSAPPEQPVNQGGTCPDVALDQYAQGRPGGGLYGFHIPPIPFPGDVHEEGYAQVIFELSSGAGADSIDAAQTFIVPDVQAASLTNHWYVVEDGGRYYPFGTAAYQFVIQTGTIDLPRWEVNTIPPPCILTDANIVSMIARGFDLASGRSMIYLWREGASVIIDEADPDNPLVTNANDPGPLASGGGSTQPEPVPEPPAGGGGGDRPPTTAGAAAEEWLLDNMSGRSDATDCNAQEPSESALAFGAIAAVGCSVEGLDDGVSFTLFGSTAELDAFMDDRKASGRGNRGDVCGPTWRFDSTPAGQSEGTILCSDATIDSADFALVQWTEDEWRVFGNIAEEGDAIRDIYDLWFEKDLAAQP